MVQITGMNLPISFFEISIRFAQKVAELTRQSIENTLLQYTNLYIRLGLGRDFSSSNPTWEEYLKGVVQTENLSEWTYYFYLIQKEKSESIPISPFGCFSYKVLPENKIRLHFHNSEDNNHSPLSKGRMYIRLSELKSMFTDIKENIRYPTTVIGASWLYNIEAYRRLFPPEYLMTARVQENSFQFFPLWGQFIDRRGQIKRDVSESFLERLNQQYSMDGIENCFPYQVLTLESAVQEFYWFYGC
jgi:hypothetical protein